MLKVLHRGDAVYQMIQVTGEEGITLEDFVIYQQALFIDMVYLQQDAFDPIDVAVPIERQQENFKRIKTLISACYKFTDQDQVREYFTRLTGLFKNLNYAPHNTKEYTSLAAKIDALRQQYC
jgi:V/A-type H+-transporting ATPase subunit A